MALCNLVHHGHSLPPPFQNFDVIPHVTARDVGHYGGSVALADYCPYIQVETSTSSSIKPVELHVNVQEFTWRSNNVVVRGSHCMYEENQPSDERNFALESYGQGARCFDHTERMWEERSCSQVGSLYHLQDSTHDCR